VINDVQLQQQRSALLCRPFWLRTDEQFSLELDFQLKFFFQFVFFTDFGLWPGAEPSRLLSTVWRSDWSDDCDQVQSHLGYCPQFDALALIDLMTVIRYRAISATVHSLTLWLIWWLDARRCSCLHVSVASPAAVSQQQLNNSSMTFCSVLTPTSWLLHTGEQILAEFICRLEKTLTLQLSLFL